MLEGEVVFRHGESLFRMLPGDSLLLTPMRPMDRGNWSSYPPLPVDHHLSAVQMSILCKKKLFLSVDFARSRWYPSFPVKLDVTPMCGIVGLTSIRIVRDIR